MARQDPWSMAEAVILLDATLQYKAGIIGSSSIRSDQDLILAVQDSIMAALAAHGIENHGEASLKDAALKWFEKKASRDYFDQLISEEQYAWKFGGQKVDTIIQKLQTGSPEQITKVMRDIITVAEDNGITALRLDIQGMAEWIKSIIEDNQISAILFVWDEFTEFFQNNPNSLTGFQTLAEISLSHPFYFMIVSHESRSLFLNAETAKKILDRFVPPIKIDIPENMAFQLMGQAMKTTSDSVLKDEWMGYKGELNSDLASVRASIRDSAKKSATLGQKTVISDEELQAIVPIHPYAALLLKHMSVAFKSNARSMFDFIKNDDNDAKAFKWFIGKYGPLDQTNLLTIDMLWNFFYGGSHSDLNDDVRVIMDSYSLLNSDKLTPDEQRVLKTVLLLQAISMRVSDVDLLKPNEQNVDLAYSGTGWSKGKARSIAEKLVRDGLLFKKPVGGGKNEYTVANSTGDAATIRKKKTEVLNDTKTQDLLVQAELMSAIQLPAPIAGRFIMEPAATKNFSAVLSKVEGKVAADRFRVMTTFALNDDEAAQLKGQIIGAVRSGKTGIIYIDAGLSPMGKDLFEQYIESMAYSRYYAQNDKHRANEFMSQATKCLNEWKNKVAAGAFMLYTKDYPSGIRMANLAALQEELSSLNHRQYPYGLEQYNVIANMFMKGPLALGAECGITQKLSGTFKAPNEKTSLSTALAGAWNVERYWEDPGKQNLAIVRIKQEVERQVAAGFAQRSGRVSMSAIYDTLTRKPYGFMPNNISSFALGFVLKEYATGDYFWSNGSNSETMTVDKMKTMIANAINQEVSPSKNFREEFIVAMSAEQRSFLNCTAKAFKIAPAQCGSIESARDQIRISMKRLSFPIWCVKYILPKVEHVASLETLSEVIDNYCNIANTANGNKGTESELATAIGRAVIDAPVITDDLARILTNENCRNGMLAYIDIFQDGILKKLATSGGTESDNWAIKGSALSDSEHRAMITSAFEHHAVLRSCAAIERLGYPVAYLSPTPDGMITPENLESVITDNTRLVSIMFANNEIGSIQPIKELCAIAHAHGALFHTDAVQAVGHIKIDVQELEVDLLSASAHKFNGPKGGGFLYIRKGVELPAYADGGLQEYGHRAGTENVAAIIGMATALKNNCDHLEKNQEHVIALENQLFQELDDLGVKYVRNGGNSTLPGLISLSFPGKDGEAILHRMDLKGIAISTGSACDSKRTEISGDENAVHWFLEDKTDTRSSNYLEDAATEIQVQGLELDYTCLLWDADMRYDNGRWRFYKFNGQTKWVEQTPTSESRQELIKYMLNAYRVLLTRARSGMVICVPEGNGNKTSTGFWEDSTRLPEYYNGTYQYLKSLGIDEI